MVGAAGRDDGGGGADVPDAVEAAAAVAVHAGERRGGHGVGAPTQSHIAPTRDLPTRHSHGRMNREIDANKIWLLDNTIHK